MTQIDTNQKPTSGKGKAFFDRADQVAETGNWDFAIEMYIQGIEREPDNVVQGHQPLRQAALNRTSKGGKPAGFMEKMKKGQGKDPKVNLLNAEYLLAKEPGNEQFMEQVLKAAQALGLTGVVKWIGSITLESQKQAAKKNRRLLQDLTNAFHDIEEYGLGIQACQLALEAEPDNGQIQQILHELMAKHTIQAGKYDKEGSFVKGVKDMEGQKKLIEKDKLSQSEEFRKSVVEETRGQYLANPTVPGKITAYVEALCNMADEGYENEAVDVLTKAYADTRNYRFKKDIGDIRMKQMSRRFRKLRDGGDKAGAAKALQEQLAFELEEFAERATNYPTDMSIKFELGRRQFVAGKLDDAIGSLQQAKRDARHAVQAAMLLGQAFEKKGWHQEAADTLEKALEADLIEDRAKEIRYILGTVYEKMGELAKAQDQYSAVAQMDYNFKDVRQRLEAVRKQLEKK